MKEIHIGLIGAGWMGTFFSSGFSSVRRAYGTEIIPVFEHVADPVQTAIDKIRDTFGYKKGSTDWRMVVQDPDVDLVVITTPNYTHAEIVKAAALAGKHIVCEKPLSTSIEDSREMAELVEKAGVISLVDFIYRRCPVQEHVRKMILDGDLGDIFSFRAWFDASYCADPNTPMTWRQYRTYAGTGALGDLTSHLVALSDMLVGDVMGKITSVCAVWDKVYPVRPDRPSGNPVKVENEDQIYILLKYENGRIGQMSSSRITVEKPCSLGYEVQGSKGIVQYDVQRLNEIRYATVGDPENAGFKTVDANTAHGEYRHFSQLNGLGLSYGDVMGIQAHSILKAIAENTPVEIDIPYGYYVERVCGAMEKSAEEGRWVDVDEIR
jgi:predicted dehydrogenase